MQRSGSTFSFNIARQTLLRSGTVHAEAVEDVFAAAMRSGSSDHLIVKAHNLTPESIRLAQLGAARIICTIRKPEDAIASFMDVFSFGIDQAICDVRAWLQMYREIRDYALTIPYDAVQAEPEGVASAIARLIDPDISAEAISAIAAHNAKAAVKQRVDNLAVTDPGVQDIGFSYYDRDSFYHRRHVTSLAPRSAEKRISASEIAHIRRELAEFIGCDGRVRD